jgi:hypothetical protein
VIKHCDVICNFILTSFILFFLICIRNGSHFWKIFKKSFNMLIFIRHFWDSWLPKGSFCPGKFTLLQNLFLFLVQKFYFADTKTWFNNCVWIFCCLVLKKALIWLTIVHTWKRLVTKVTLKKVIYCIYILHRCIFLMTSFLSCFCYFVVNYFWLVYK